MLPSVTREYKDHSTQSFFQFSFYCDVCGSVWMSERYPYSLRNSMPVGTGEESARVILWKAEHDAAYERANTEALFHFNRCPECERRVCDNCICEIDTVCRSCKKDEIKQKGEKA